MSPDTAHLQARVGRWPRGHQPGRHRLPWHLPRWSTPCTWCERDFSAGYCGGVSVPRHRLTSLISVTKEAAVMGGEVMAHIRGGGSSPAGRAVGAGGADLWLNDLRPPATGP